MKHEPEIAGVPVVWQKVPLVGEPLRYWAPEGLTLLEIIRSVPSLPLYFEEVGVVRINGERVPREYWPYLRPKVNGQCSVTLHIELQGTGSSSKTIATLATVAVIALAAVAGPEAVTLLGLTQGTALAFGVQAAVSAAVAVGGSLLISALAPPPSVNTGATGGTQTKSIKTAALQGNTIGPGDALARVLGFRRVFPQMVCQPIVELVGDVEIVEGVYGLAGPHQIDAVYAGDVPLSSIHEVTYEICDGFLNSQPQGLVNRQGFVAAPNTTLSNYIVSTSNGQALRDQDSPTSDVPFYHRFQTRQAPDEFWMSLSWAEGLVNTNGNPTMCPVRLRIRIRGTTTWTDLPEVHFRNTDPSRFAQTVKLMWQVAPTVLQNPDTDNGAWTLYYSVPAQTAVNPVTTGFTANSYFYKGSGDTYWRNQNTATTGLQNCQGYIDRVEFYLDPAVFPKATYEVEIVRGQVIQTNTWSQATYFDSGPTGFNTVYDLFGYWIGNPGGITDRVNNDQSKFKSDVSLIRATSIWNTPPVAAGAGLAVIAVRSTGRSLQQLSCDAGGYCPIPLAGNFGTFAVSTNPADHYRDVLSNVDLGAFPLLDYQIDDLTQWRQDCDANGYTINCVIQGMKQMDVLNLIASAGFARPIQCETWGVAEDKDRTNDLPIQIFTPRNLREFQWTRTFAPFIDGFRVKFDDATNIFVENEFIVLDPEAFTGGERLEDIRYETIITQADAQRRALFDLKQARRRLVFYSGTVDIENLVCRRGNLVGVTHDILSSEVWSARVKSTTVSGGNITGLILDDTVPEAVFEFFNVPFNFFNDPTLNFFHKPQRVGVCIRTTVGTMLVKEVTGAGGDVSTITFVTPFVDPGTIVAGCLITFGVLGSETRRLLVQNIKPKADMVAVLTMVDEAPDLWATKVVTALLHFDGTAGATTTVDSSSYADTVTMTNAVLTVATAEFGNACCIFNGTNAVVAITEVPRRFDSQTDFTVDFWFNSASAGTQTICCKGTSSGFQPWRLDVNGGNFQFFSASIANTAWDIANGLVLGAFPSDGAWHHFAICRAGGYFLFFLDGNLLYAFYNTSMLYYTTDAIRIGNYSTQWYNGYIDEFRYTNGLARWVSSFNVPIAAGTP